MQEMMNKCDRCGELVPNSNRDAKTPGPRLWRVRVEVSLVAGADLHYYKNPTHSDRFDFCTECLAKTGVTVPAGNQNQALAQATTAEALEEILREIVQDQISIHESGR